MEINRVTRAGALLLALAAPLFLIANLVVGLAWTEPAFSWATNNVSDLGNVTCGVWDTTRPRYVCSPWHDAMNVAFVLTAVLLVAGLLLTRRARGQGRWSLAAMVAGAAGLGLAGAFPADVNENVHLLAAVLVFLPGNAGLLALGWARRSPAALVSGLLGLTGAVLFIAQQDAGMGLGAMERVAVFPLAIWACYAGCRLLISPNRVGAGSLRQWSAGR
ncbi:hypothetical protein ACTI_84420 [Actinoplanes sp. OR16]|uniref:DUF998 domain-containing protein n=1 Tax=Actinoplanes sp. OR16 TaxID=946334 RepID=UPI000F6E8129|nr:DUF998 domain-containing protein [Actinoplanes sp. OR16]BBH71757.1 hypothetical protein ACTI_84420 [Actinoplanes sp. OR16]